MIKIATGSGHSGNTETGASNDNDFEDTYNDIINAAFIEELKRRGCNTFLDISMPINQACNAANHWQADLAIQHHFNAGGGKGIEVLCWGDDVGLMYAKRISEYVSEALGRPNRGAKVRQDLGFIRQTSMPAIIIEWEFIDSPDDFDETLVKVNINAAVKAAVNAILGNEEQVCPTCKRPL